MNRLHPRTSLRRLPPRATVIGGAALGLLAGAAVYGGVSSSASDQKPVAFVPPKAPVAAAPVSFARCAKGSTLEKNVCVVRVVKTVIAPVPAAAAPAATKGSIPASTVKPSTATPVVRAAVAAPVKRATPVATSTTAEPVGDDEGTVAGAPAPTATASPTATPAPSAAS